MVGCLCAWCMQVQEKGWRKDRMQEIDTSMAVIQEEQKRQDRHNRVKKQQMMCMGELIHASIHEPLESIEPADGQDAQKGEHK